MSSNLLTGPNVLLRIPEPADIDILYNWENDSSVWQVSTTIVPFSRFQLEQYVLNSQHDIFFERQLRLMIELNPDKENRKPIGCIDLFDYDPLHMHAGVGIMIISEERGKGYASEAIGLLIRYCFDILHCHQLFCNITAGNKASIGLFSKLGFIRCGVKKEWRMQDHKWVDEIMFQLIRKE
ncbi:MAG: GNAT family protein [Bacteroidetes bacterium]|nr:GNAT family protein [Bacteroidota bacterium]